MSTGQPHGCHGGTEVTDHHHTHHSLHNEHRAPASHHECWVSGSGDHHHDVHQQRIETEIIRSWRQCWSLLTTTMKIFRMSRGQPQSIELPCRGGEGTPSDLQPVVREKAKWDSEVFRQPSVQTVVCQINVDSRVQLIFKI